MSGRTGLPAVRAGLRLPPANLPAEGSNALFLRLREKKVSKYHLLSDGGVNRRRKLLTYVSYAVLILLLALAIE